MERFLNQLNAEEFFGTADDGRSTKIKLQRM